MRRLVDREHTTPLLLSHYFLKGLSLPLPSCNLRSSLWKLKY